MNLITIFFFLSALQICANNQKDISIAYPVIHLKKTLSETPVAYERISERLGVNHHTGLRDQLTNHIDLNDYVLIQKSDGTLGHMFKDYLPGYKAYFDMSMLHTASAVPWIKRKLSYNYDNSSYFANKFDRYRPIRVFHCVGNYRYKGFRDYVKNKPGFQEFILDLGEQLKSYSQLHKKLAKSDNLQDFAALKNMYQEKMRELEQKTQAKHQADLRKILSSRDFSEHSIKLLEHHGIANQFLYDGNMQQRAQLKQITGFMNEVGEFRHEYHKTPELNEIAASATGFGVLANNANRENLPANSQAFLEIGQNLLALGRGLVAGCERNLSGIYHMVRHPIDTGTAIANLIKNIGIGIGNVAILLGKNEIGHLLNDQALIDSAQQDMGRHVDSARQIYQYAKQAWQDKSKLERYELVGNLAADLLLAKGLPVIGKLAPIKNLAQYKPIAFAKLGNVGREINQIAGLTCAKGPKYVKSGFEVLQQNPWIVQSQKTISFAIKAGRSYLNSSNAYLDKLARHSTKCALDPERRLMRWSKQVKKIPKDCIAKTKQFIGDEAVVIDAYGNKWTSKVDCEEWLVQLSENGKENLILLNETAREVPKGVILPAKKLKAKRIKRHVKIDHPTEIRQITAQNRQELGRVRHKYKNEGKTYGQMYGPDVPNNLKDKTVELKGFSHIMMPELIETTLPSGEVKLEIVGMHWDYHRQLEKAGLYYLENIQYLEDGSYIAHLRYQGALKPDNTFFPSHWPLEKVLEKIEESSNNKAQFKRKWNGSSYSIVGNTAEGIEIKSNISKQGRSFTHYANIRKPAV